MNRDNDNSASIYRDCGSTSAVDSWQASAPGSASRRVAWTVPTPRARSVSRSLAAVMGAGGHRKCSQGSGTPRRGGSKVWAGGAATAWVVKFLRGQF